MYIMLRHSHEIPGFLLTSTVRDMNGSIRAHGSCAVGALEVNDTMAIKNHVYVISYITHTATEYLWEAIGTNVEFIRPVSDEEENKAISSLIRILDVTQ